MTNPKRRRTRQQAAQPAQVQVWSGSHWDPQWRSLAGHTLTEANPFPWVWTGSVFAHDFTAYSDEEEASPFAVIMGYLLEQLDPRELISVAAYAMPLFQSRSAAQLGSPDGDVQTALYLPATRSARIVFEDPQLAAHSFVEGKLLVFPSSLEWRVEMLDTDPDQLVSWIIIKFR